MLKIIYTLAFLFFGNFYYAQSLSGKIVDKENNAISFAEIILTKNEIKKTAISDEKGNFTLQLPKNGDYLLEILQDGNKVYSKTLTINGNVSENINIETKTQNIQEVTITGNKKLIERKIDRLIFNVENSVSATGGDALDALKITPGIRIQNDQISMVGKSGMSVMIDDRLVQLSGDDLTNYLKSIPSDNIKSIEVITTPPAKYDAEGNSGIVNIVLKKAKSDSWSNAIRSTYNQAAYSSFSVGNNFIYQKNKFSLLFDLSANKGTYIYANNINYFYPEEHWINDIYNRNHANHLGAVFNLGYKLSNTLNIGFQYLGNIGNPKTDEISNSNIYNIASSDLSKVLKTSGYTERDNNNHSLNLNLMKKLDTLGKQFTVDLDYFIYKSDKNNTFDAENIDNLLFDSTKEYVENSNLQKIDNLSAKIDFEMPYKWAKISFGSKVSFTESNNNIDISKYDTSNPDTVLSSNQTDHFTYKENIQSLYFSTNKKFGKKWEAQAGLRAEATQNQGISQSTEQTNKNDYIKLFPTLYLSYHNEKNTFSISYARRINRPSYSDLNPARWFLTATSYEEGNPFLQPSFTTNIELSHTYNDLITTSFSFSKTKNGFSQLAIHDLQNEMQSSIRRNYFDENSFVWSEYINYSVLPWWNANAEVSAYYAETKAYSEYLAPKYSGWGGYFSSTNDFTLNKSKTFLTQLIYEYSYPSVSEESKIDSYSNVEIGLKLLLLKKQLQIALNANNILGSDKAKISNTTQNIFQTFSQYYDTQYIKFSLSYRFGNKNISEYRRNTSNEDEKGRAN